MDQNYGGAIWNFVAWLEAYEQTQNTEISECLHPMYTDYRTAFCQPRNQTEVRFRIFKFEGEVLLNLKGAQMGKEFSCQRALPQAGKP